ncbi:MAG TPA: sigma-70 family RNA polymerase sigma factor [Bryobacteraceae bacterium]|jgi:RNA polymerase sigma-70 factor (ECF subfamily)
MLLATKHEVPVSIIPNKADELYRDHHAMVFRTAYRITGNAQDAEDVLQTVFLRIVGRDPSDEAIQYPENYLRRAAVHGALDLVRARRASAVTDLERLPASGSSPDAGDLREMLRRAVAQLPARAAEIFTLRFFEGLSNPEIARALKVSAITVAVSLHRSRGTLRKKLRNQI